VRSAKSVRRAEFDVRPTCGVRPECEVWRPVRSAKSGRQGAISHQPYLPDPPYPPYRYDDVDSEGV